MNGLDITIILILLLAALAGLRKGFISQIISIAAIILSVWLSFTSATALGDWLMQHIKGSEIVIKIIAFLILFVGVGIVCNLIGKLLEKLFKVAMLGWLNRLLGALLSAVKFTLVLCIIALLFNSLNENYQLVSEEFLNESKMYVGIKAIAESIFPYFQGLISQQIA